MVSKYLGWVIIVAGVLSFAAIYTTQSDSYNLWRYGYRFFVLGIVGVSLGILVVNKFRLIVIGEVLMLSSIIYASWDWVIQVFGLQQGPVHDLAFLSELIIGAVGFVFGLLLAVVGLVRNKDNKNS